MGRCLIRCARHLLDTCSLGLFFRLPTQCINSAEKIVFVCEWRDDKSLHRTFDGTASTRHSFIDDESSFFGSQIQFFHVTHSGIERAIEAPWNAVRFAGTPTAD
mgnify:CR=1 FL=1